MALATVGALAIGWGAARDAALAQPIPLGPQLEVSSTTGPPSYNGGVAFTDDGDFMVVWYDYASLDRFEVLARRFDADGTPQAPAFVVNTYTTEDQVYPRVAGLPAGEFVVTWQSYTQDDDDDGIFGQRFDGSGAPAGSEFAVNTHIDEAQRNPAVASDASGRFVVAWDSYYQFGTQDRDDVVGRRFDATAVPLSPEFQVNANTTGQQDEPDVAALPSGEFMVVWEGDSDAEVEARVFASDGSPVGSQIVVDPDGHNVRVAAHDDGFVVVFYREFPVPSALHVRPYDASGMPLGASVAVASEPSTSYPDVAATAGGRFLVVWNGSDGSFSGVVARLFDPPATPIGDPFVVNTYTTGGQYDAAITSSADGEFVVTWAGSGPSGPGIFARRLRAFADESVGVTAKKLIVLDRLAAAGDAKTVYVSKDASACITKGAGTDVAAIDVGFTVSYDSASGAFTIPAGASDGTQGWLVNSSTVAKYSNKSAPSGATSARVAVVKPGKLLKIVGKSLGDAPIDLIAAGPPSGIIITEYRVTNGGDTFRYCSAFDPMTPNAVAFKEVAGGTGRKLVARDGLPIACP